MKKNPNVNKYNRGLKTIRTLKPDADCCSIPNAKRDYLKLSKKRQKQLESQERRFGFTDCETWDLDYTACVWLYSHIKMMLDIGGKVVDFEWEWWDDEFKQTLQAAGVDTEKYHNDKMVFEYICELFEEADELQFEFLKEDTDERIYSLHRKAFAIFGIMLPRAWW